MALSDNYFEDQYLLDPSPLGCSSRNSELWSMRSYLIKFLCILCNCVKKNENDIHLDTLKPLTQSWFSLYIVNVYSVVGTCLYYTFTCTAHICLLNKGSHVHSLTMKYNTIEFSISNMVSELLLWHFLSNYVFIGVTPFSTSLLPL